ncbi:TolC family outer membrane protein [Gilvimarinus polysaccharolyticus]|uniref:TolC family outer membrane protein n=1 Tax=Gilvimarinus polysaccharolyticus TaxID=863921 RepID=UPI000A076D11|nr:TolC family outer membrane protein [Gilvimarinus polysaccharolyticus]
MQLPLRTSGVFAHILTGVFLSGFCAAVNAQSASESSTQTSVTPTSSIAGVAAEAITSRDVVLKALDYNPEVQAAWHTYQAAIHDVGTARGGYLPSIDLVGSTGKQRRDYDDRDDYDINQLELSLTQMLFDGFRVAGQVNHLEGARQVRYLELLDAVDNLALESFVVAEDLVRYRTLLKLARANYQEHLNVQSQIGDRVDQGVGRRADLDQVDGRVALAESNLLVEAANLHDVTAKYLRIVGDLPPASLVPSDLQSEPLPNSVKDLLYAAYRGNPGFHAAIKNIAAAQATVRTQRSGYYPRVELRARYGTQQNLGVFDDRTNPSDFGDEGAIELAFTYNLFSGGSDRAAVNRSLSELNTAKDQRDVACVNLRQTTQIAYNNTRSLAERLVSLNQHREASDRVRRAYSEQFQIGQRTLLDLLDAENEYFQSSRSYIDAQHELNIARAQVLESTGKLLSALNIVPDELPVTEGLDEDLSDIDVEPSAACPALSPSALSRDDLLNNVITYETVSLFADNSSVLTNSAMNQLDQLLVRYGNQSGRVAEVVIGAQSAAPSPSKVNRALARARVTAVRDYLVINGIDAGQVEVEPAIDPAGVVVRPATDRIEITVRQLQ